ATRTDGMRILSKRDKIRAIHRGKWRGSTPNQIARSLSRTGYRTRQPRYEPRGTTAPCRGPDPRVRPGCAEARRGRRPDLCVHLPCTRRLLPTRDDRLCQAHGAGGKPQCRVLRRALTPTCELARELRTIHLGAG